MSSSGQPHIAHSCSDTGNHYASMGFPQGFASSIIRFLSALLSDQLLRTPNEAVTTCQHNVRANTSRTLGPEPWTSENCNQSSSSLCCSQCGSASGATGAKRVSHQASAQSQNIHTANYTETRPGRTVACCRRSGRSVKPATKLESTQRS